MDATPNMMFASNKAHASFSLPLTSGMTPAIALGSATPTFTRPGTESIHGYAAGAVIADGTTTLTAAVNELGFTGARRVAEGSWSAVDAAAATINTGNGSDATYTDATGPFGARIGTSALLSYPVAGNVPYPCSIVMQVTPSASTTGTVVHWSVAFTGGGFAAILSDGTNLIARMSVGTVIRDSSIAWARTAATVARVGATFSASGPAIFLNGAAGS